MSSDMFKMEILGQRVRAGTRHYIELDVASLYTRTRIQVPVIVQRASKPGPCLLVLSGIHGDEINGIEITRRLLFEKLLKPIAGSIICVPVVNVMAFLNMDRKFADGRDLNRCFPGSSKGSLGARLANSIATEIVSHADYVIDLHSGADNRKNHPQIRYGDSNPESRKLADAFNADFTLLQPKPPRGSLRRLLTERNVPSVIFEGGKSRSVTDSVVESGMRGVLNVGEYLGLLAPPDAGRERVDSIHLTESHWVRARTSGMLEVKVKNGDYVEKGQLLAHINGPFAQFQKGIFVRKPGYVICVSESPVVQLGDAIFHIGETG